jgi:hypothetical protein
VNDRPLGCGGCLLSTVLIAVGLFLFFASIAMSTAFFAGYIGDWSEPSRSDPVGGSISILAAIASLGLAGVGVWLIARKVPER